MDKKEVVLRLKNLHKELGESRYSDLWSFEEPLNNAIELLDKKEKHTPDSVSEIHANWILIAVAFSASAPPLKCYRCSNCNIIVDVFSEEELLNKYSYCNCGAKMSLGDENNG